MALPTRCLPLVAMAFAVAVAIGACGKKEPVGPAAGSAAPAPATVAASKSCPGGANDIGVGKPCASPEDCRGLAAIQCPKAADPDGVDFCTRVCLGVDPNECGQGASCVLRGNGPSICAPNACAQALTVPLPNDVSVNVDCKAGAVELGVGQPCAAHADCQATKAAHFCPRVVSPKQPAFCTMLCRDDADCGGGAFCWRRLTDEGGRQHVVASCAPVACKAGAAGLAVTVTPTAAPVPSTPAAQP